MLYDPSFSCHLSTFTIHLYALLVIQWAHKAASPSNANQMWRHLSWHNSYMRSISLACKSEFIHIPYQNDRPQTVSMHTPRTSSDHKRTVKHIFQMLQVSRGCAVSVSPSACAVCHLCQDDHQLCAGCTACLQGCILIKSQ